MDTAKATSGIGFPGAFFLVLFVLKVTGVIGCSWWWVTAPLWAPLALFLAFGAGIVVIGLFIWAVSALLKRR